MTNEERQKLIIRLRGRAYLWDECKLAADEIERLAAENERQAAQIQAMGEAYNRAADEVERLKEPGDFPTFQPASAPKPR